MGGGGGLWRRVRYPLAVPSAPAVSHTIPLHCLSLSFRASSSSTSSSPRHFPTTSLIFVPHPLPPLLFRRSATCCMGLLISFLVLLVCVCGGGQGGHIRSSSRFSCLFSFLLASICLPFVFFHLYSYRVLCLCSRARTHAHTHACPRAAHPPLQPTYRRAKDGQASAAQRVRDVSC